MKIIVFTAFLLLSVNLGDCDINGLITNAVSQVTKSVNVGVSGIINTWIDTILDAIPLVSKTLGLNALPLKNFDIPITPPLLGITLKATLSNATVSGFDTLHRIGSGSVETDVRQYE
ncbi:unnamed protein product [Allacma fusca]|uniref:Uncharacterized protein n=1 Tax=Allacma fusca TaxID=39272 RepID=A0A8J2L7Z9_9HEXA|nr:unnamed protein product [Allacma fusca]